jgi:hypothetical protein
MKEEKRNRYFISKSTKISQKAQTLTVLKTYIKSSKISQKALTVLKTYSKSAKISQKALTGYGVNNIYKP